jgi:ADP-ribosylglycohydrolase
LLWLVNAGGDTDTNAAIAGGLMGARDGESAVPAEWIAAVPGAGLIGALAERLVGAGQDSSIQPHDAESWC